MHLPSKPWHTREVWEKNIKRIYGPAAYKVIRYLSNCGLDIADYIKKYGEAKYAFKKGSTPFYVTLVT